MHRVVVFKINTFKKKVAYALKYVLFFYSVVYSGNLCTLRFDLRLVLMNCPSFAPQIRTSGTGERGGSAGKRGRGSWGKGGRRSDKSGTRETTKEGTEEGIGEGTEAATEGERGNTCENRRIEWRKSKLLRYVLVIVCLCLYVLYFTHNAWKILNFFLFGLFPIWGRRIKFSISTFFCLYSFLLHFVLPGI